MKKKSIAIILTLLIIANSFVFAQSDTTEYVVIVENANIRVAPHIDGKILDVVSEGDIVQIYNEPHINGWYRVKLEDDFGYIHGNTIALAGYTPVESLFEWNGNGNFVSAPFEMPAGDFFANVTVDQLDLITIEVTSVDGKCSDEYILSSAVVSPEMPSQGYLRSGKCKYVLEVESKVDWSITVEEITPDLVNAEGILIGNGTVLEGIGDTATTVTGLPAGFWNITGRSEGDSIGLTARVLEGGCDYFFEFEFEPNEAPIKYQMTYRTENECVIVWEVTGGLAGEYDNYYAAPWSITFEKVN